MSRTATYPPELRYHAEHDWARVSGDTAEFGITWYAQDALGDVVFFEPPAVGDAISANGSYGELESVKAVSDLIAPLDGEVIEVNQAVIDRPESVNEDPYDAWLVKVRLTDTSQVDKLLTATDYEDLVS